MVRLEAFLEDNKAGKVLHALEGLVIQMTMVPVKNAVAKGNKVVGAGGPESAADAVRAAVMAALKRKQKEITTPDILNYGTTYGFKRAGLMAAIGALKKEKVLRKGNKRGIYIINVTQGVKNG